MPILPETWQLTISKDKEKQFSVLKDLLFRNDVTEVINACDAGREGELIFRFVMEKAGEHQRDATEKEGSRLYAIHQGRACVHTYFAHILTCFVYGK